MKKWFIIGLLAAQVPVSFAQDNAAPSPRLEQKSFSTLPENAGFLQNSVNLFTGQVQFGMPVVSIAGKSGLSYGLSFAYSSAKVKTQSGFWNREAPTGVLGLGWNIDLPKIVADNKNTGTREDDTFYLVEGGSSNELFYDGLDGTEWKFYPKAYQFWKIRYNPTTETWIITKEDGNKYVYGDANNSRKTVQYVIKYGNWIGDSNLSTGQSRQVNIWNLSEVIDLWNDKLTFEYIQDSEVMGGSLTHTKASYLKEIKNSIGERITLTYLDKIYNNVFPGTAITVKEYQDMHTEAAEPDAYQEKFESKYLDKVTTYLSDGQVAESFQLSYDLLGANELAKRLLKSVQRFSFAGVSSPPLTFDYEKNTANNTGTLLQLTLPTKGTVSFNYQIQNAASTSDDLTIPGVAEYYEPKVWFTDDYVVLSRRNLPVATPRLHSTDAEPVIIDVFTWENGKWIQKSLGPNYSTTGTIRGVYMNDLGAGPQNYQKFDLVTGKDFFATISRRGDISSNTLAPNGQYNTYYGRYDFDIYKRNPNIPGGWYHYHEEFNNVWKYWVGSYDYGNNHPTLLAGDDFILLGGQNTLFKVYEWNGSDWGSWSGSLSTNPDRDYFYTAGHNYFVVHDEDETATDDIDFYYKNKANQWQSIAVSAGFNSEYSGSSRWHASNTSFVGLVDDNTDYIWSWDENYSNFSRFSIGLSDVSNGSPVTNTGTLVGLQQIQTNIGDPTERAHGLRYNGQTWISSGGVWGNSVDYTCSSSLGVGNDYFLTGSTYKRYNANTGTWNADYSLASPGSAANQLTGYNYFLRGLLYFITPSGTLTSHSVAVVTGGYQAIAVAGADFLVANDLVHFDNPAPADIYYKTMKNGAIIDHGYQHTGSIIHNFACSNDQEYPSRLVGSNAFLTARGHINYVHGLEDAYTFLLSRRLKDGELSDYVVTRVTTYDGTSSKHTSYVYDQASSTVAASGQNFQFNKVTSIAGSDNPAVKPNGSTETYFFNGKLSSELSADGAFPAMSGVSALVTNVNTYLNKFTGLPYKVVQKNSAGTIVSENTTDYYVYNHNQSSDQAAFYVRPWYNVVKGDGKKVQTYNVYDATTKQLESEQITSIGTSGATIQTILNEYTYWWEIYDVSRTANLLTPSVSKRTTINGVLTSISSSRWTTLNSVPCPMDSYAWVGPTETGWYWTSTAPSANWKLMSKINLREQSTGVILQSEILGARFNSTIWDVNNRLQLAKIANANYSEVAYCGFEDSSTGNLAWSDGSYLSGNAKTGSRYFRLGSTGITKGSLSGGTTYQVSFWVKSDGGVISISGVLNPVTVLNSPDWQLLTFEVNGLTSVTISNSGGVSVDIDDVRIHPVNATMTTSSYHPLYGRISETDARNKTVYYEFDNTGKVKFVKDDDKNIVKHVLQNIKD